MKIDDVHISEYGLILARGHRHDILPTVENKFVTVPGKLGSYRSSSRFGVRAFSIPLTFLGDNQNDLQTKIRDITHLFVDEQGEIKEVKIQFDYEDVWYTASIDGDLTPTRIHGIGEFSLNLIAYEPFAYGLEKTYDFINDQVTLQNIGTANAFPVFNVTFTASATDFKVQLGDKYVRVIRNFLAGDQLIIDSKTRKVIYNSIVNMPLLDLKSRWFELTVGENTMNVTPTNVANVEVTFQERWL